jgi:hypothetical protein
MRAWMMKPLNFVFFLFVGLGFLNGCSLAPDQKVAREQLLKQAIESFENSVVQGNWTDVFGQSDGSFDNADKLKTHLMKTWVQDATLTGGDIASMAWVNDTAAKVKINWAFQSGSVQSFSSETFVWIWKGGGWKYAGRAVR